MTVDKEIMGTLESEQARLLEAYEQALPFYRPFIGTAKAAKKHAACARQADQWLLQCARSVAWHLKQAKDAAAHPSMTELFP